MTNKTINGVPREQIQRTLSALSEVGKVEPDYIYVGEVVRELRALLAAPDPAKCQNCGLSTAEQCDDIGCGFLSAGNGAPDPIVEADGIGEPVAWYVRIPDEPEDPEESPAEYFWANSTAELNRLLKSSGASVERRFYSADQLASLQSTIAHLRQHKNDYMEAAEETRKALTTEIAQLKAENERLRGRKGEYPECSSDPNNCPENEVFGCCATPSGLACPGDGVNACKKCPNGACLDEVRRINP